MNTNSDKNIHSCSLYRSLVKNLMVCGSSKTGKFQFNTVERDNKFISKRRRSLLPKKSYSCTYPGCSKSYSTHNNLKVNRVIIILSRLFLLY